MNFVSSKHNSLTLISNAQTSILINQECINSLKCLTLKHQRYIKRIANLTQGQSNLRKFELSFIHKFLIDQFSEVCYIGKYHIKLNWQVIVCASQINRMLLIIRTLTLTRGLLACSHPQNWSFYIHISFYELVACLHVSSLILYFLLLVIAQTCIRIKR